MNEQEIFKFENVKINPIKGFPELHWKGKHPYSETLYYPAQMKEEYITDYSKKSYVDIDGKEQPWINKLYWGDNLQVMSHLLKEYRGKVDLIYIDPPFDSKADYKKKIKVRGQDIKNDSSTFEEKQYGDIWANDDYLQFMYERLILMRELLSDTGSIYLHCDWHKSHYLRCILDEVIGFDNFRNEIIWCYTGPQRANNYFSRKHDSILFYSKTNNSKFNIQRIKHKSGLHGIGGFGFRGGKGDNLIDLEEQGKVLEDWWSDISTIGRLVNELEGYPTQKPEALIERIIKASSNPGDLVFDCFMGSGTTQAVAMKLSRRFIGADINLGAIHTSTKRLLNIQKEEKNNDKWTDFEVYNVNNYDLFRNPVEAKNLILEALNVNVYDKGNVYDGELDGYKIKVMNVNRITTKADLETFRASLPYKTFEERKIDKPNSPVEKIEIICMGHEPDLAAAFAEENINYKLDIKILDILTDRKDLTFKRDSEANVKIVKDKLVIKNFYPLNLLQKLSMDKNDVDDYRQLVDAVLIDFNYDGDTLRPDIKDIPEKNEFVKGEYDIPKAHGRIKIKITDILSESIELEIK